MFDERHDEWVAMRPERSQKDSGIYVPNLAERGCEVIISFIPNLLLYVKLIRPNSTYACHKVVHLKRTVTNMCLCGVPKAYKMEFGASQLGVSQITSKLEIHDNGEIFYNWVHILDDDVEIIRMMNQDYLTEKITAPLTQAQRGRFLSPEDLLPGYWRRENRNSARRTGSGDSPLGHPFCKHWEHASEVD